MKKPLVAIDLDDTLAATTQSLLAHLKKTTGLQLHPGDITTSAYWTAYGIGVDEAIRLVHGYNLAGFPGLQVMPGAQEAVRTLAKNYELLIVTSRDPVTAPATREWLATHFGSTFVDVVFAGNVYVSKQATPKSQICLARGAAALVEDSAPHAEQAAQAGIPTIFFGDFSWQQSLAHPLIHVAKNWPQAVERLQAHVAG